MSVVLDGGGEGSLADSRNIGEGRGEKAMIIAGMERMREGERETDREGCKQACSRRSG